MRIGLVVERFDPSSGGQERWTVRHAQGLVARGHETHVIARTFHESFHDGPIYWHPVHGRGRVAFAREAEAILKALALDIAHDTGAGVYCDVFNPHYGSRETAVRDQVMSLPAWLRPIKRAMIALLPRYRTFRVRARRQYAEDGRLIMALSQRVADDMARDYGVAPSRIRVVRVGIDVERFAMCSDAHLRHETRARHGLADETTVVLFVAHNPTIKGAPTLLRALARLRGRDGHAERRPAVHALMVGDPRNYGGVRRLARKLGLADQVTLVGRVADVRPYYAAADVFAYPTRADACATVVLEAMAAGLPVITTDRAGSHEVITNGVDGHVLRAIEDDAHLAELLALHAVDPGFRRAVGARAQQAVAACTIEKNIEAVIAVYEEILSVRGQPQRRSA